MRLAIVSSQLTTEGTGNCYFLGPARPIVADCGKTVQVGVGGLIRL